MQFLTHSFKLNTHRSKVELDVPEQVEMGITRERGAMHDKSKVLRDCTNLQFFLVPVSRIPLLNTLKYIMRLLGITKFSYSSAIRLRHEGPWTWSPNARLDCCGFFLIQPPPFPFFAILNILVGYGLLVNIVIPLPYWGLDIYNAHRFPIFSSHLFTSQGHSYDISAIVNDNFEINLQKYEEQGRINLSIFIALSYGFGFATIASTLTHVALFYGTEIYKRCRASYKGKEDIHTQLMRRYADIPSWWFYFLLAATIAVSLVLCIFLKDEVQIPWWGLLFAAAMAFIFTLPISIITATTNQFIGRILAGTINIAVAWWLLTSIKDICQDELLPPDSPWTCPGDRVFFDASVIWGLVGPKRIFGTLGNCSSMNWFFLGGALGPVVVWVLHKAFPKQSWIPLINLPVLLGATSMMPPATSLNYNSWILVGTICNFFVFRY